MNKVYVIIGILALASVSFMSGIGYERAKSAARAPLSVHGYVMALSPTGLTLQSEDGAVTALIVASTSVQEIVRKGLNDLLIGQRITLVGNPAKDGSMTARTILLQSVALPVQSPAR